MKINIFIISVFFSVSIAYGQKTTAVILKWTKNSTHNVGDFNYRIPSFDSENHIFNPDDLSLKYGAVFSDEFTCDPSTLKVSNVVYETISSDQLGDLSIKTIPSSFSASIVSSKSRDLYYTYFYCTPIINENGVFKKIISLNISYDFKSNLLNRSANRAQEKPVNSVLSTGNWYKFSLVKSGAYKLTKSFLQQMGFDTNGIDPKKIKIYGNGGRMVPLLNSTSYPYDLQEIAVHFVGNSDAVFEDAEYFLFYGEGVDVWNEESKTSVNLYDSKSYYYVTTNELDSKTMGALDVASGSAEVFISKYDATQFYEQDLINPVRLGRKWFGEDFSTLNSRNFLFNFPNLDLSSRVYVTANLLASSSVATTFTLNLDKVVLGTKSFTSISTKSSIKADEEVIFSSFVPTSDTFTLNLSYNNNGVPSSEGYLDYIKVSATCFLKGYGKQFHFKYDLAPSTTRIGEYKIDNASGISEVWDVTDIYNVKRISNPNSSVFSFNVQLGNTTRYLAIDNSDIYIPTIESQSVVSNQNLKGTIFKNSQGDFEDVDYIIITNNSYKSQADRLAEFHKNTGLRVRVVTLNEIYTEFSSGKQDIGAIRNCIKYVYDNASSDQNKLKYVCLFGGASFDYKNRVPNNTNIVPVFHSNVGFSLSSTFVSDDFYGLMDADEGDMVLTKGIDIAVGRMLFNNENEANIIVNKVINYNSKETLGKWRNDIVLVADDVDEDWEADIQKGLDGLSKTIETEKSFVNVRKIYADSYKQEISSGGERYPQVKNDILKTVERGVLILNYFGHGGEDGLAHERILDKNDILELKNQQKLPLIITATCEFSRFDNPYRPTAGEFAYLNSQGGAISLISTTRQITVPTGLALNNSLMRNLLSYNSTEYKSIAEGLRLTKNTIASSVSNTISYIGDPVLKLNIAKSKIVLTHINDKEIGQVTDTLKGLGLVKLKGSVLDQMNNLIADYNGVISVDVFDKKIQTKTLGNDNTRSSNKEIIIMDFETLGESIFKGNATVKNGIFEVSFIVPKDIKTAVGNGRVSFYSREELFKNDYTGVDTQIKIGGFNKNAPVDNTPPKVKLYLNNENFVSGGIINTSPVLIANLEDENGISTAGGIGHDIVAYLDGDETKPIVLNDYYETNLNDYKTGRLSYSFTNLEKGMHTLQFKVWDVYNNPTTTEIQFVVVGDENLVLDKVLNYPNPFVNYTEFWFNHNKPNEPLDVRVQIFTITGKLVKTINQPIFTTGFLSRDIKWDGLDDFGDKIAKGVYVYKLAVKATLSNQYAEKIEKLVVF